MTFSVYVQMAIRSAQRFLELRPRSRLVEVTTMLVNKIDIEDGICRG